MKTKIILFALALLIYCPNIQGQFLKKLKKKLEQTTENVIINKTSQKAGQQMDNMLDDVLNMGGNPMGSPNGVSMGDASQLPDSYDFDWKYTMEVVNSKDNQPIEMVYYLKPNEKYIGMQPDIKSSKKKGDMFIVMDVANQTNAIFMTNNNKKTGMVMKTAMDLSDIESDENLADEFNFEEIPDKTINGKLCKGFKMENADARMVMYNDMDAPVSFSNIFGVNTKMAPKGFNPKWLDKAENSMVMEVTYTDKKNNNSTTMRCTDLSKHDLEINKHEYEFASINSSFGN